MRSNISSNICPLTIASASWNGLGDFDSSLDRICVSQGIEIISRLALVRCVLPRKDGVSLG